MPSVSIVIPNYNEKENLERGVLDQVSKYLDKATFKWEVLISDDGSTDGSKEIAKEFCKTHKGFTVLENPHGGKAEAVWSGIQKAQNDIVLFTDMDQSTPLAEIEKLLPWYDKGYDIVFGSRGSTRDASIVRQLMAITFLTFRRIMLLRTVVDTQCGFKSFRTKIAKQLFPQLEILQRRTQAKGWVVSAFDVELLFLGEKAGYKLKEVPVVWKDRDVSTGKNKNFVKESLDMLKQILRVKRNDLTGRYKL